MVSLRGRPGTTWARFGRALGNLVVHLGRSTVFCASVGLDVRALLTKLTFLASETVSGSTLPLSRPLGKAQLVLSVRSLGGVGCSWGLGSSVAALSDIFWSSLELFCPLFGSLIAPTRPWRLFWERFLLFRVLNWICDSIFMQPCIRNGARQA